MSTITPAAVLPISGATGLTTQASQATTPTYSGTFIPTLWSAKLNAKFYAASTFADTCNRNWEGDINNLGDKVVINNIPTLTVQEYSPGNNLTYQTPSPSTLELAVDRAKYYAFNVNDVLEYQAKPDLMDMFSNDAAEQMRIVIDSTCWYRSFSQFLAWGTGSQYNRGATAGVKSGSYNMGTDQAPVILTGANILQKILEMAAVMDEQNIPDSGRYLVLDPLSRTLLMQSNLAQAQFMGDDKSMIRNGLIGTIDRFKVYVSNLLPYGAAGTATPWISGDGSENSITTTGTVLKRRLIVAGHTAANTFASQMVKTEQFRNPNDFGDLVRGLQVFGHRNAKPEAMVTMVAG